MEFGKMLLSEYGVFDSRVKFPEGVLTQPRQVEEYEIELYTEDQTGIGYIGGMEVPLKKGTLICAHPGSVRYSRLPFRCLYLHLQTDDPELCRLLRWLPEHCTMGDLSAAVSLFRRIISLDPGAFPEERLMLQSCIMELIYRLLQEVGARQGEVMHAHRKTMQWVEQYIRQNPHADLELKALAQKVNLSASYFHKLFTGHFGTTPAEYVLSCRIAAAKSLLVEGQLPMEEVAKRSGFSSQSYFNYCFKQQTGQTPLQYRKEHLSRLVV